ncbi:MAG: hypothetical protein ABWW69_01220 [Pyrodictiaceae archaeon]
MSRARVFLIPPRVREPPGILHAGLPMEKRHVVDDAWKPGVELAAARGRAIEHTGRVAVSETEEAIDADYMMVALALWA